MENILLQRYELPNFSELKPDKIEAAIDAILANNRSELKHLLDDTTEYTWDNLIEPQAANDERLAELWSLVSHMHTVVSNDALRKVYHQCLSKLSDYDIELSHNVHLFKAVKSIESSKHYSQLDPIQQRIIKHELRDFKLAGVDLNEQDKASYKDIENKLTQATNQFEENLMDATDGWTKLVTSESELAGMPEYAIQKALTVAQEKNKKGWLLTLEYPCYEAVVTYANNRELRREMYTAYVTRASEQGPQAGKWDNSKLMEDILAYRHQQAQLVGFDNFAKYNLQTHMVKEPQEVLDFLQQLATKTLSIAKQEIQALRDFAKRDGIEDLQVWDTAYYSEKLCKQKYDISTQMLRPYFQEHKVIAGMFALVKQLYGIDIVEKTNVDIWHKDVKFYEVYDPQGNLQGQFYTDLYAREHKRGGAWVSECRYRRKLKDGKIQIPISFLTCNFAGPSANEPSLLTHEEVITLFHEFGHCLHHVLSKMDYIEVSGMNDVPWDAVEFPSQFMEHYCWQKSVMDLIAEHYKTQQPLPDELFQRMNAAKNFQAALAMIRQIVLALFDFRIYKEFDPQQGARIQQIFDEVRSSYEVMPIPTFNRFQHSFSHIFAGGYAAGYYSYKWAEVLASDAFSLFEEKGITDQATGLRFLHAILEQGGSKDMLDLFVEFRGRKPEIDALLRHSGLSAN